MAKLEMIISAREKDLGGFSVRRILPYASHRMVGPFIFFDHMGPAEFPIGKGIEVRPHPHINLATVTYLFEGRIRHRDGLGTDQVIEPGAINWMTAGRGIVHSERALDEDLKNGAKLNGIQLWVALPEKFEEVAPTFSHHPSRQLPEFEIENVNIKLLLGEAFGKKSPVPVHSDLFYCEIKAPRGARLTAPAEGRETALYVVKGKIQVGEKTVYPHEMAIGDLDFTALEDAHVMALGGSPVGERFLYWNFVSSDKNRLEEAKRLWALGPRVDNPRFTPIPGDEHEFIPLPTEPGQPKGTIA